MNIEGYNHFFKRQIFLDELGESGQKKLQNSHILVIGAGGLGCPFLQYTCAAGIGKITLFDHDQVDYTNLHRQLLYTPENVGLNKAKVAADKLNQQFPFSSVIPFCERFDGQISLENFDLIIDCSDNFKTKFLIHDLCFKQKKRFLMASIHKFEGLLQYFDFALTSSPCLRCLYPERPSSDCVDNCAQAGVVGATAGILGSLEAMEAIKILLNLNPLKSGSTLLFDLIQIKQTKLPPFQNSTCPLCVENKDDLTDPDEEYEISLREFLKIKDKTKIINLTKYDLNLKFEHKDSSERILFQLADPSHLPFSPQETVITICQKGISSLRLTKKLRDTGYLNIFSLEGGIEELLKKL